jgi:hypothetical protein
MRHFAGFILALVMSAALFFGAGWGVARIIALHGTNHGLATAPALTSLHGLLAVAAVAGTGLLLGILLAVPGISPLATGLPGLALLGWSALVVLGNRDSARLLPYPGSHYAAGFSFLLLNGMLAVLGAAMIIPLLIPTRWRRPGAYADDYDDDDIDVTAALGLTR